MNLIRATFFLLGISVCLILSNFNKKPNDSVFTPKVQVLPSLSLLQQNRRIADLFSIAIALENYKKSNRSYPISKRNGAEWDYFIALNGNKNPLWIKGLVPKYIDFLPVDSRESINILEQYAYKSNGANYKLVAYSQDCENLKIEFPQLLIPEDIQIPRELWPYSKCIGYSFWTSVPAAYW